MICFINRWSGAVYAAGERPALTVACSPCVTHTRLIKNPMNRIAAPLR
jgi:hypothetical protein